MDPKAGFVGYLMLEEGGWRDCGRVFWLRSSKGEGKEEGRGLGEDFILFFSFGERNQKLAVFENNTTLSL